MNGLNKLINIVTKITKWMAYIGAISLGILMVLLVIDIVASKWLGWSVPGAMDFSEELMVFLTILPIAYIVLERKHISISVLEDRLKAAGRLTLVIIQYITGIAVSAFITWRTFTHLVYTIEVNKLKAGIDFPIWPANLVVVIGFGFLTIVWILVLARTLVEKKV